MKKTKRIISLFAGLLMIMMVPTQMDATLMDLFCKENYKKLMFSGIGLFASGGLVYGCNKFLMKQPNQQIENIGLAVGICGECMVLSGEAGLLLPIAGDKWDQMIKDSRERLITAAKKGDAGEAQQLIDRGWDVNYQDDQGNTALHYASSWNRPQIVACLIKNGPKVETKNLQGKTALHYACLQARLDIVKILVKNGMANVNIKDKDGWTPLQMVADAGNLSIVKYLVEQCKVDVNIKNCDGETALLIASLRKELEVVQYLIQHGAIVGMSTTEITNHQNLDPIIKTALLNALNTKTA